MGDYQIQYDITRRLEEWRKGNQESFEQLIHFTYPFLLRQSKKIVQRFPNGTRTCPYELLHESFFRLRTVKVSVWQNRMHFYHICSKIMKHVHTDKLRHDNADKRGGNVVFIEYHDERFSSCEKSNLEFHSLLNQLRHHNEYQYEIVRLRYQEGYTVSQVSKILNQSTSNIKCEIAKALAWMKNL